LFEIELAFPRTLHDSNISLAGWKGGRKEGRGGGREKNESCKQIEKNIKMLTKKKELTKTRKCRLKEA
jgi:hypothetical protein